MNRPARRDPVPLLPAVAVFVLGFLSAWAIAAVLPTQPASWALIAPFLLTAAAFAVLATLFAQRAKRELRHAGSRAGEAIEGALTDARQSFDEQIQLSLTQMRSAIRSSQREGEIIYEPDFDNEEQQSQCYGRLIALVDEADHSLFAIPNPYSRNTRNVLELTWRDEYLRAIERKIADKHAAGEEFEYIRIQQVPAGTNRHTLSEQMGRIESEHVARLQEMPYGNAKLMVIDNDEITGQLIVDERIFVNLISAVDQQGRKRMVAIAIMTDPLTDSVSRYHRKLKSTLMAKARLIMDL